jgi:serpin B
MRRSLLLWFAVFGLLFAPAVARASDDDDDDDPPARIDIKEVAQGNTKFSLKLYDRLRVKDGNLFFSPFSISTALAMTSAGARGKTLTQMEDVLALPDQKTLHPVVAHLLRELNASGKKRGYQLSVANALWGQSGHKFQPEFTQLLDRRYDAKMELVDFIKQREEARKTINRWVEKRTQDRIKDLIKPGLFNDRTRLVLTNAIYFKGDWQSTFKKANTRDADFHLADGKKVKTPLMYQGGRFAYTETRDLQVLEMPYVGKDVSMVVLLPRKADGLQALEKSLTAAQLKGWLERLRERRVFVYLPKFKMTSEFQLKPALTALGMEEAFTPDADFSGMDGTKNLFLADVVHKAFVDVNEKGTEAAAATGVIVVTKSKPVHIPEFRADRPFLFLIRDRRFDNVLFLGRLSNPKS